MSVDELLKAREHLMEHERRLRELASEISQSMAGRRYNVFYLRREDVDELKRALEEVRRAVKDLHSDLGRYRDSIIADAVRDIESYVVEVMQGLERVHEEADDIVEKERVADLQISITSLSEIPDIRLFYAREKLEKALGDRARDIVEQIRRLDRTRDTTVTNHLRELAATLREIARKLRSLEM